MQEMSPTSVSLEGKVAFITGASSGIGAATARALAERGVRLGLASRRSDSLGLDGVASFICDVRNRDDVKAAVDDTVARFGRLDIVIANAGVGSYRPVVETSLEQLQQVLTGLARTPHGVMLP